MIPQLKIRNRVKVPLKYGVAEFISFDGLSDGKEHLVICFGSANRNTVQNLRLHSECMTGEVFGSEKCDCAEQLDESLSYFSNHDGYLVYLRQEGRGIGLYNKLDAYDLQNAGLDTVQANQALSFADDIRDYKIAADMLHCLGIKKVKLFSNNPLKEKGLTENNIQVIETAGTGLYIKPGNTKYLQTKATKSGHKINQETLTRVFRAQ